MASCILLRRKAFFKILSTQNNVVRARHVWEKEFGYGGMHECQYYVCQKTMEASGFEPATFRPWIGCSTTELRPRTRASSYSQLGPSGARPCIPNSRIIIILAQISAHPLTHRRSQSGHTGDADWTQVCSSRVFSLDDRTRL